MMPIPLRPAKKTVSAAGGQRPTHAVSQVMTGCVGFTTQSDKKSDITQIVEMLEIRGFLR